MNDYSTNTIINENRTYWTRRAPGYSELNQSELSSKKHAIWRELLCTQIISHFEPVPFHSGSHSIRNHHIKPTCKFLNTTINEKPENNRTQKLRILDIGTGPGFFSIILAEAGFSVTAIDLTPSMLAQAKRNAGALAEKIHFYEMNAENLSFADYSFDVIVSRNLTWNLPHPEHAYREWKRVLKPGGLLLNFDANWYRYLFDEDALSHYEEDRENTAREGIKDENIGEGFDVMEGIAHRVPLSKLKRPEWDQKILKSLGFQVSIHEDIWKQVWTDKEKINFSSTPLFMVKAIKN
ncbi:MAG: class I SAM-dependent methyltransferase [Lachnospiraceae bacterium]|nr:class I SAM-dependent methyltransferase [Lachnospiraceae bacterium]